MFHVTDLLPLKGSAELDTGRGGYTVTMRESWGTEPVLRRLLWSRASDQTEGGRLHLGWGSFRNLDIIAARQSGYAILCDINVHQFAVWRAVRTAVIEACDGSDFIGRVVPLLPMNPPLRQFHTSTSDWLKADGQRRGSWLNDQAPERFFHIQSLLRNGRIVEFPLDMRSGDGEGNLFCSLSDSILHYSVLARIRPDTLYVSNIPWMMARPSGFFGEQHRGYLTDGRTALEQARHNLSLLAPLFSFVVSASRLSPLSSPSDLQWRTELSDANSFLSCEEWDNHPVEQTEQQWSIT